MAALLTGVAGAPEAPTMARPTHLEDHGRAFSFVQSLCRKAHESVIQPGTDRLLEIAPFLTTVLLLSVYPLLRYLLRDPFPAEVFRFAFISFWIGFLIVNMVRAQKTRQAILQNMEVDWLDRLRASLPELPGPKIARLVREYGKTALMVTHDPLAAQRAHVVLQLEKGRLVDTVTARGAK